MYNSVGTNIMKSNLIKSRGKLLLTKILNWKTFGWQEKVIEARVANQTYLSISIVFLV